MDNKKTVKEIINEFDISNCPFSEYTIYDRLRGEAQEIENDDQEAIAESMAFAFCENYKDKKSGWGTYYGPMIVRDNGDGTVTESPSIHKVTDYILQYWSNRAREAVHPILRARYADLVWDFAKIITGKNADFTLAQITIDNNIKIAEQGLYEFEISVIKKLERALGIALSLKDSKRIKDVKNAIINFEDKVGVDDKPGLWGFSFDLLYKQNKNLLSEGEKQRIINGLEERMKRLIKSGQDIKADPWAIEAAALRLADYYKTIGKQEDITRVLKEVENAFEIVSEKAAPLQIMAWFERVHSVYMQYNIKDDADRIKRKLREIGPKVVDNMKIMTHSIEIPREEMEKYISQIVEGGLETALIRIAVHYIPKKGDVEKQLYELSKKAPITFLGTKNIVDNKGRTIAKIGSLGDDLEGNIIHQTSQNLSYTSLFLRRTLEAVFEKYNPSIETLEAFLFNSPLFEEDKRLMINKGLKAYFEEDFLTFLHIILPQIESSFRNLLEISGGTVLKPSRNGGFNLKTLDEILRDDVISSVFSEDASLYFRILLTDQRGWNVRNNICHGLGSLGLFNQIVADRMLHVLLCLGIVRENTEDIEKSKIIG